jgi:virginiamycin A acetyltransferase
MDRFKEKQFIKFVIKATETIVAGAPSKVIKFRFEQEKIDKIQNLKWWRWSEDELRKQQSIFK